MKLSSFSVLDHYPPERHPGHGRSIGELYRENLAQAALADELGYDSFFVAEHHFDSYGVVPNTAVWLAAAAMRTRRIRLGPAISVLPFRDPRQVAEDFAMLDQLAGGRLVMGVGSGYLRHEFEGFGVDGATKRERFDEALALVRRLWAGETVTHHGRFWSFDQVAINVRPLQAEVPLYVAVLRREAAYHVGRAGHDILLVPYATVERFAEIGELLAEFRRGAREAGRPQADAVVALHAHVAESDAAARASAAEAFDLYVATRRYARRQTYDDIMASGLSLMGSVATVTDKLVALHGMGVTHVMLLQSFGGLVPAEVARSMRSFAADVLPRVRRRLAAKLAA
jgi:alkanesulfonate monooxygenase SsuD/methylene tetrahydromethanopterin reductase-like flavin-dependent oxidoreductase (luciferase family)